MVETVDCCDWEPTDDIYVPFKCSTCLFLAVSYSMGLDKDAL